MPKTESAGKLFHVEQLWNKFKNTVKKTPDLVIFALLLFSLPFGSRTFIATIVPYSPDLINEWTSIFIYASDVLILLLVIFWLRRHAHNSSKVVRFVRPFAIAFIAFVTVGLAATILSPYTEVGIYGILKYAEYGIVFVYALVNIITHKRRIGVGLVLFTTGSIQAIIAICQFIGQKSVGLAVLGESVLSTDIDNVAEVATGGEKILRVYGTLPHPNVLGYILIMSMFLGLYLFAKMKSPCMRITLAFLAGLQLLAFILTFSRSAWLAMGIGIVVILVLYIPRKIAMTGTLMGVRRKKAKYNNRLGLTAGIIVFLVMAIISVVTVLPIIQDRIVIPSDGAGIELGHREFLNGRAIALILEKPVLGWGVRSFVPLLAESEVIKKQSWMLQPIHNAYLGLWVEVGLFGLLAFMAIIILRFRSILIGSRGANVPRGTISNGSQNSVAERVPKIQKKKNVPRGTFLAKHSDILFSSIIIGGIVSGLVVMIFDHYILDVHQGALMFWVFLGL
ncbi:O-antigen ligase family protein [Patescibacteria group bacterium]